MKEIALQSCSESKGRDMAILFRASRKYNYTKLIIGCVVKNLQKILDSEIIKSNTKDTKKKYIKFTITHVCKRRC